MSSDRDIWDSRAMARILLADKRECQGCGVAESGEGFAHRLHVHHWNGDPMDNRLDNLVKLCPRCHGGAHAGKLSPSERREIQTPAVPDGWVMLPVAAQANGVSRRLLELRVRRGELRAVRIPGIRPMCIRTADVQSLFAPAP